MTSTDIKRHLTVKNIFIAIVALNILSAFPLGSIGGTFHETSKEPRRVITKQAVTPASLDQNTVAHMVPGETLPEGFERPAKAPPPGWKSSSEQVKPKPQRTSNSPPGVNWIMLLSIAAMALYARYLAAQMAQNAVVGAVESIKHIAGALKKLGGGGGAASKQSATKQSPAKQGAFTLLSVPNKPAPQPKPYAAPARKNTVVRASRWPLFG